MSKDQPAAIPQTIGIGSHKPTDNFQGAQATNGSAATYGTLDNPLVRRIEYFEDGQIKSVEFYEPDRVSQQVKAFFG